jgi:hypothetical protein
VGPAVLEFALIRSDDPTIEELNRGWPDRLIGFEGMAGAAVTAPRTIASSSLRARSCVSRWRLLPPHFRKVDAARVMRKVHALTYSDGFDGPANARLKLGERLAGWLLMCDQVASETAKGGHHMSSYPSCSASGATVAVQILEGKGLIRANRGGIGCRSSFEDKTAEPSHSRANSFCTGKAATDPSETSRPTRDERKPTVQDHR